MQGLTALYPMMAGQEKRHACATKKGSCTVSTEEKIRIYLDRVIKWMDTPFDQRDQSEYEELLMLKAEICATAR